MEHGVHIYNMDFVLRSGIPRSTDNICDKVTCGKGAFCKGGACYCPASYQGDPYVECEATPKPLGERHEAKTACAWNFKQHKLIGCVNPLDKPDGPLNICETLKCGFNAHCEDGACRCNAGFYGDPKTECEEIPPAGGGFA